MEFISDFILAPIRCVRDVIRIHLRAWRIRRKLVKSLSCDTDWEIDGGCMKRNEVKIWFWHGPFGFFQHIRITVHDVNVWMPAISQCCVKRAARLHMLKHIDIHI